MSSIPRDLWKYAIPEYLPLRDLLDNPRFIEEFEKRSQNYEAIELALELDDVNLFRKTNFSQYFALVALLRKINELQAGNILSYILGERDENTREAIINFFINQNPCLLLLTEYWEIGLETIAEIYLLSPERQIEILDCVVRSKKLEEFRELLF